MKSNFLPANILNKSHYFIPFKILILQRNASKVHRIQGCFELEFISLTLQESLLLALLEQR